MVRVLASWNSACLPRRPGHLPGTPCIGLVCTFQLRGSSVMCINRQALLKQDSAKSKRTQLVTGSKRCGAMLCGHTKSKAGAWRDGYAQAQDATARYIFTFHCLPFQASSGT
jgi:hypothetical protein